MATKATHGGARQGSGRKPVSDPVIQLAVYVRTSRIKKMGGKKKAKSLVINYVENYEK